jgi:hypothetical protein
MGLGINIVFPDRSPEIDVMHVSYSTFGTLRAVIKFNETPETAALPGAKAFHDHSDCEGEWSTEELRNIATYLDAILADRIGKVQRDRPKILTRIKEEQLLEDVLVRVAFGSTEGGVGVCMYPATFPEIPTDMPDEHDREEYDGDDDDEDQVPSLLALPPSLHYSKMRDYDEWVPRLALQLREGAEKNGKAVFC